MVGVYELVGENLAFNTNVTLAQIQLERSNFHLQNMVNPQWTRVGLGISQDLSGYFYLVQDFASRDLIAFPLTSEEVIV